MILPFQREWLRNRWFVIALSVVAVACWFDAVREIRTMRDEFVHRNQVVRGILELETACDYIAQRKQVESVQ